jgi:hypothetical protein
VKTVCTQTNAAQLAFSPKEARVASGGVVRFVAFGSAPHHAAFERTIIKWSGDGRFDDTASYFAKSGRATFEARVEIFPSLTQTAIVDVAPLPLRLVAGTLGGYGASDGTGDDARLLPRLFDIAALGDGRLVLLFDSGLAVLSDDGTLKYLDKPHAPAPFVLSQAVELTSSTGDAFILRGFPGVARTSTDSYGRTPLSVLEADIDTSAGRTLLTSVDAIAYLLDDARSRVLRSSGDTLEAFAGGDASAGSEDGERMAARFFKPRAIAADSSRTDALYVLDGDDTLRVRRIDLASGLVSTILCRDTAMRPLPPATTAVRLRVNDGVAWIGGDRPLQRLSLEGPCVADLVFGATGFARTEDGATLDPSVTAFSVSGHLLHYGEGSRLFALDLQTMAVRPIAGVAADTRRLDGRDSRLTAVTHMEPFFTEVAFIDADTLRISSSTGDVRTLPFAATALGHGHEGLLVAEPPCRVSRFSGSNMEGLWEGTCARIAALTENARALYIAHDKQIDIVQNGVSKRFTPLFSEARGMLLLGETVVVLERTLRFFDARTGEAQALSPHERITELGEIRAIARDTDDTFFAFGYGSVHRIHMDAQASVTLSEETPVGRLELGENAHFNAPIAATKVGSTLYIADAFEPAIVALDP